MITNEAIEKLGSRSAVCEAIGITRANATHWGYWIPKKAAQELSFEVDGLEYDHSLYSGNAHKTVRGKTYTAAPWVSSTHMLNREIERKTPLFFFVTGRMVSASKIDKDELNDMYRNHEIYEVKS